MWLRPTKLFCPVRAIVSQHGRVVTDPKRKMDVDGFFQAGFSRLPGEENPFARKALLPRHSGTNQTPAVSRFAFHGSHSKPMLGSLERIGREI